MRRKMRDITIYLIALTAVALMLIFSLSAPMMTTSADFSIYNTGWNGCSRLAVRTYQTGDLTPSFRLDDDQDLDVAQRNILDYDVVPNSTSILFLGPDLDFTSEEIDHMDDFLRRGGKVVLADDLGTGNQLLDGLNTSSRFSGNTVFDVSFEKRPDFSVVYDFRDHELTQDLSFAMLNRPTYLIPDDRAMTLMNTSEGAWVEEGEDTKRIGKSPVMSIEDYGDGELILISDPSIMINSMIDKLDNGVIVSNLLNYISEDRTDIIIDESHRDMSLVFRVVFTGRYPERWIATLGISGAILATAAAVVPDFKDKTSLIIGKLLSYLVKEDEDEDVLSKVLNKHSGWDKHKVEWIYDRLSESTRKREDLP